MEASILSLSCRCAATENMESLRLTFHFHSEFFQAASLLCFTNCYSLDIRLIPHTTILTQTLILCYLLEDDYSMMKGGFSNSLCLHVSYLWLSQSLFFSFHVQKDCEAIAFKDLL